MTVIAANMQAVRSRIARAEAVAGRVPDSVALLAVSKTCSATAVRECYASGQRTFGENYLQEALDKKRELADLPLEWHFIGPIQSNKTRPIAEHFDWVHGVEREKIAARLNDARPAGMLPLNVCIQVNVSGEASKAGIAPGEEVPLAAAIARMPRLKLRGLMAIPEPSTDTVLHRHRYALLRELKQNLEATGMSDDLEAAIAEGATLVRVGTAIFGRRA